MAIRQMSVGDIVTNRPVYFVLESDDVAEAARYMAKHQIGAVPVLEEGYVPGVFVDQVGIFSERDLMTRVVAEGLDPASTRVEDVMTDEVVVLDPNSTCRAAMAIMEELHIRHLPVLSGRQLLGTVSIRDLQETEADIREAELRFLDDYFDRMDEAAWGLVPVEQISERVVIQCKQPRTVAPESERAPVSR
ncbi:MAG: CBS domain-containing protein [Anaerolineae bacterium]|jgi:CBS domain-containing protein